MNGRKNLTDYFLSEADKDFRNIHKILLLVSSEGNGRHVAFLVLWNKEHNKEKELSQVGNGISWSWSLCSHSFNGSSTLIFLVLKSYYFW